MEQADPAAPRPPADRDRDGAGRLEVLVVVGTRPDAVKMAPVVHALRGAPGINVRTCATAQHRSLLDSVLGTFDIRADYDLDVMRHDQDPAAVAARVLAGMTRVLRAARPDLVLVHGDTTTSFSAALAAFYDGIDVGHVEAGLRTRNLHSPWPEEANRQLTARLARYHFAPTETARRNLLAEGVEAASIVVTGNTVIDSLLWMNQRLDEKERRQEVVESLAAHGYRIRRDRQFILVTGHRRENIGAGIRNICIAVRNVSQRFPDLDLLYPLHPNPRVRAAAAALLAGRSNVIVLPPLDYPSFVWLMRNARLILTDSGGIQEEAPALGKPVLVTRSATERPEAVAAGTVRLVGARSSAIEAAVTELLEDNASYRRMARALNPYGDGHAAERIRDFLLTVSGARRG